MGLRAAPAAVAASVLFALGLAVAEDRWAPGPAAVVSVGGETAFGRGLHRREIVAGHGPQRWTSPRASFRFVDLPPGGSELEVRLHGNRTPVVVGCDGVTVGVLEPGLTVLQATLPPPRAGTHEVELSTEGFEAGDGRRLGALLDAVSLRLAPASRPSARVLLGFAVPAALVALAALRAGLPGVAAVAFSAQGALAQALLLWPQGLIRSPYATVLAVLMALGALGGLAFARWRESRDPGTGPWAFATFLVAFLVQVLAATSPIMVVSDEVFHANNLARVSGGEWFLTSLTQHARPFRFPYGVSFYALLVPLLRLGIDGVTLVRAGAGTAGLAGSLGLFALLAPEGARRAGLAVVVLQLLPGVFDPYSFGNLSNVFGQAMTTLFFCWWAGRAPGGWPLGAALLALGCLGHFSSLVVLVALAAALLLVRGRAGPGGTRTAALAVGLGLAAVYYLRFVPLVVEQLPRLREGGGQGRGASRGPLDALRLQIVGVVRQWGPPAIVLGLIGRPRGERGASSLDRDLAAYWAAGFALAVPAVFTPLDVRYLLALTVPLAAAAGAGAVWLRQRGPAGALTASLLLGLQVAWGVRELVEAVVLRYRT